MFRSAGHLTWLVNHSYMRVCAHCAEPAGIGDDLELITSGNRGSLSDGIFTVLGSGRQRRVQQLAARTGYLLDDQGKKSGSQRH